MNTDLILKIHEKIPELNLIENAPLRDYTTFKIGGPAAIALPSDVAELSALLKLCRESSQKYFILGNGSNVLASDNGYDGLVIKPSGKLCEVDYLGNGLIRAGAGALLSRASTMALRESLTGLEFASGIPGSVGGALHMNAGAYGEDMSGVILGSRYIDQSGNLCELPLGLHDFNYRHSFYSDNPECTVVDAVFELKYDSRGKVLSKMEELFLKRRTCQPLSSPSAGSVFRRPEGCYAGRLIEEAGLKGHRIGGAEVSQKHAGFIINIGGARASDVRLLIEYVQETVYNKFGVSLKTEVIILE